MTRPTLALLAGLTLLVLACGPAKPTPSPTLPAPSSHGYLIDITIQNRSLENPTRDVDCTIAAFSGKTAILIKDPKTNKMAPYVLQVTLNYPDEQVVHIYDPPAAADRIEFVCLFNGLAGDSILCETTLAETGRLAALFTSKDFGLIEKPTGVASCSGVINNKERL